jgi:peptidoglycan/xylan/chitin deacetylase (PgdA/CDA1 family)
LIDEGIPCTYFISTQHILGGACFPHDLARGQQLAPNSPDQIRWLAGCGIEIGAHTRTHANLGAVTDPAQLADEIVVAKREVEELSGRRCRFMAFPYGQPCNMSPQAFRLAREAGYDAVCSAYGGYNFPGDDPFHLQRIHADSDMTRLRNWLSLDARKERIVRRYEYAAPVEAPQPVPVVATELSECEVPA